MKKIACLSLLIATFFLTLTAQEKKPWDFSIVTDFAYYPKAAYVTGGNHFAPSTGIYSGVEFRTTGIAGYTIPIPFGDSPLVSGNKLRFFGALEISPVSIAPAIGINFSPIAFLDFSAGASIGGAWDFIGIQGLAKWNHSEKKYNSLPFQSGRYDAWISGTFQFDLAAIIPGEWNHVITLNTYKLIYKGVTHGGENGNPWLYQGSGEQANGLQYLASVIVGYQMPIVLNIAAIQVELSGHYNGTKHYASQYHAMNPNFMDVGISPIGIFKLSEHDFLTVLFQFNNRRSFTTSHKKSSEELYLQYSGNEWYFKRIALSYKHSF